MMNSAEFQQVLSLVAELETVESLLAELLPWIRDKLSAAAVAVFRSVPPEWRQAAALGLGADVGWQEAAAEALDRGVAAAAGRWQSAPLDGDLVLVARDASRTAPFAEVARWLDAALRTVRSRQRDRRRLRRLETLLEILQSAKPTESVVTLLEQLAKAATTLLDADRATIFLWDRPHRQLVGRPALGFKGNELRIRDDAGVAGQVLQSGEPRRVGGGRGDDQIDRQVDQSTGYTTRSLLCVPLETPGGVRLGVFEAINKRRGEFTDEDQQGLLELARHSAIALHNTQEFEELVSKHRRLVEQAAQGVQLVGDSPAIEALRSTVKRIADTDLAILILGENGVGKEVVARSIHYLSRRRDQPFVAVNCAALAESLLESELFGHEKGAFTDAREARAGKFEVASGGTLFLDEIGDMSLGGQAKLLRVLEDKTVVRVGGSTPILTDVRVLAATNQNLLEMVRAKRFREDLFYRLNVVSLELPPLRDRGDDIVRLAEHFVRGFCTATGRKPPQFSAAARKRLLAHAWPGNVRELRNLCERLAYLTTGDVIESQDLTLIDAAPATELREIDLRHSLSDATRQFQQEYIQRMIDANRGRMTAAAKKLGLHRSNLYRKMKQLDMEISDDGEE